MNNERYEVYKGHQLNNLLVDLDLEDEIVVIAKEFVGGSYTGKVSYVPWLFSRMNITEVRVSENDGLVVLVVRGERYE